MGAQKNNQLGDTTLSLVIIVIFVKSWGCLGLFEIGSESQNFSTTSVDIYQKQDSPGLWDYTLIKLVQFAFYSKKYSKN